MTSELLRLTEIKDHRSRALAIAIANRGIALSLRVVTDPDSPFYAEPDSRPDVIRTAVRHVLGGKKPTKLSQRGHEIRARREALSIDTPEPNKTA